MRLNDTTRTQLLDAITHVFGDVEVYLFGSRVDDTRKGGDIDIAIVSDVNREQFRNQKLLLMTALERQGWPWPLDVVQYNKQMNPLLRDEIESEGVPLRPE